VVPQSIESATFAGRVTKDGSGFYCRVYRKGVDGYTGQSSAWTNSETGEFIMTSVSAGTYVLYADVDNAPPYYYGNTENLSAATRVVVQPGQTRTSLNIALPLTPPNYARVSGTVFDNLGRPLPLAQVSLSSVESYSVQTAADGTFLFSQVLAGSNYQLSANKLGYHSQTRTGINITAGAVLTGQDQTLTAYTGGEAAGFVRNASGLSLAGAYASISGVNVSYNTGMYSDLNGEYYFPNLAPGEYNLSFSYTGYQGLNLNGIQILAGQIAINDVTMTCSAGKGMVSGTVRDASGYPACQIYVQNKTGSYAYFTTGLDGRYLLAGIDPTDSFEVYCPYESGLPGVSGLPVFANGITEGADIVLQNTYTTVSGKVTDATGTPVYYASVYAEAVSGNNPGSVYTNRLGNYRIGRVRTDGGRSYRVYASKDGWVTTYYGDTPKWSQAWVFDVLPGDTEIPGIDVSLLDGGWVSGAVLSGAGMLLPNVHIYFQPDDSELSSASFYTDAGGRYLARGLAAGAYKVRAKLDNWAAQYYSGQPTYALADNVNVVAGKIVSGIDFLLSAGGGIAGRVVNTSGIPLDSVYVYVDNAQQTECSGNDQTNANGEYTVTGLYTDSYRVRAQKTGYTTQYRYSISVVDAETTSDIDFVLYRTDEPTPTPTQTPDPNATPTDTPTQKPGDFNIDGDVDPGDLILLIDNLSSGQSDNDLNGDGKVDYKDFLKFSTLWGR
jgi:protocatechuate 3,4-dioxygenase beta subunit